MKFKQFPTIINIFIALAGYLTTIFYYTKIIMYFMSVILFYCLENHETTFLLLSNFLISIVLFFFLTRNKIKGNTIISFFMIGLITILIVIFIILLSIFGQSLGDNEIAPFKFSITGLLVFAKMIFAFSCQHIYPCIIKKLKKTSKKRRRKVIFYAVSLTLLFYALFGLLGYFLLGTIKTDIFTALTTSNFLENSLFSSFTKKCLVILFDSLKILFSFVLIFSIIFQSIAGKDSLMQILSPKIKEKYLSYGIPVIQVTLFLIFGIGNFNPETFLTILGSIAEPFINFILPSIAVLIYFTHKKGYVVSAVLLMIFIFSTSIFSAVNMFNEEEAYNVTSTINYCSLNFTN